VVSFPLGKTFKKPKPKTRALLTILKLEAEAIESQPLERPLKIIKGFAGSNCGLRLRP
jgi:hypothetical protein